MIKEGREQLRDVVSAVLKCPIDLRLWNKRQGLVGVNPGKMCGLLMIPPAKVTPGGSSDALRGAWVAPLLPAATEKQVSKLCPGSWGGKCSDR